MSESSSQHNVEHYVDIGVKRKCQVLLVSSVAQKSAGVLTSGLQYVLTCVVKHKCRALVSSVCVERLGSRVEGEAFKSSVGAAWSAIYASRADQVKAELF